MKPSIYKNIIFVTILLLLWGISQSSAFSSEVLLLFVTVLAAAYSLYSTKLAMKWFSALYLGFVLSVLCTRLGMTGQLARLIFWFGASTSLGLFGYYFVTTKDRFWPLVFISLTGMLLVTAYINSLT